METTKILVWFSSVALTLVFLGVYYFKTWKKPEDRELLFFDCEDGERYFDFSFLKKIIFQLITIFLTGFSLVNVILFCFTDAWVYPVAKNFLMLGALIYLFDSIEKSTSLIRDEKKKRRGKKPDSVSNGGSNEASF